MRLVISSTLVLILAGSRLPAQCLPSPAEHWLPDSPADDASFGLDVGLSGDWAVVGSHLENDRTGAVYVYKRTGLNWAFHQKLVAPADDAQPNDEFGVSLAIDGDTMVIGARHHGGGTKAAPGRVYVYVWDPVEQWAYRVRLSASGAELDPVAGFGANVDLSGETIVAGAHADSSTCPEQYCGAVYVFVRPGSTWPALPTSTPLVETAKLRSDEPWHGESFGDGVAIDDELLAVNAYSGRHLGVDYAGIVYVYERPTGGWSSDTRSSAVVGSAIPNTNGEFGVAIAVQKNGAEPGVVVIGARSQSFGGVEHGAAFVVNEPTNGGWTTLPRPYSAPANLLPSALSPDDHYGLAVAIDGNRIVVTAPLEDTAAGQDWGRAYVFQKLGHEWRERFWLEGNSVDLGGVWPPHLGGLRVAIQGRTVLVGTHLEDTTAGLDSGAARLFQLRVCPVLANAPPQSVNW